MSAPLWTGEALAAATGGRPIGAMPAAVTGVSIDTRTLQPGDAFFAIKATPSTATPSCVRLRRPVPRCWSWPRRSCRRSARSACRSSSSTTC